MSLYNLPYVLDFSLENSSGIPRPDGAVPVRIDGRELLRQGNAPEGTYLDFASLRVADRHFIINSGNGFDRPERDCPVQFVPDPDFDPANHPCGTIWIRLWKFPWLDTNFPRYFRLYFDTVRGGGKRVWIPNAESPITPQVLKQSVPGTAQIRGASGETVLGFTCPEGRKPGFHPVTTPQGQVVTDLYPRDHIWHRGVWFAWTDIQTEQHPVRPYTFWGEPHTGIILDQGLSHTFTGPLVHGFTHQSIWCTEDGIPLLDTTIAAQHQSVDGAWNWLDLTLTLTARDETVHLKTAYGHLTARAPFTLEEAKVLDSASGDEYPLLTNDHSPTEITWTGYTGRIGGGPVSLLLLDDPANDGGRPHRDTFFEPDRPFLLENKRLFVTTSLNPIRDTPITIAPGESRTWRYRVVTSDRLLNTEFADYHYQNWAEPLSVVWADNKK